MQRIHIELKSRCSALFKTRALYRDDTGSVIRLTGSAVPSAVEVEFKTFEDEDAIIRTLGKDNRVTIPKALFNTQSGEILVHFYTWGYGNKKLSLCRLIIPIRDRGL